MSAPLKCPNCGRKGCVYLCHIFKDDLWYSKCKACGYKSIPTNSYHKANNWNPQSNPPKHTGDD